MFESTPVTATHLPDLKLFSRGKVRDNYEIANDLLIVATDRISAFDCILPNGIPDKGRVLTQLSAFWFDLLRDVVPNHLITIDFNQFPAPLELYRDQIEGRSMLVRKVKMIPIECVARGYVSGSGWKDYKASGAICGIALPPGLRESERLPEPIFTPASKAETGHDENIPFSAVVDLAGTDTAHELKRLTLAIYSRASAYAEQRGIIIADTKFEFGFIDGRLTLGDEVLTPDSSRFWPKDTYSPGAAQKSFDKQFVRDYLETLNWNKQPPAPNLPEEVVNRTSAKYREAYEVLTGSAL